MKELCMVDEEIEVIEYIHTEVFLTTLMGQTVVHTEQGEYCCVPYWIQF
jgi:hypothetical protein